MNDDSLVDLPDSAIILLKFSPRITQISRSTEIASA